MHELICNNFKLFLIVSKEIILSVLSKRIAEQAINEELKGEQSNITLKIFYTKLGEQLEMDGVPKLEVSKTGYKILVEMKREKLKDTNIPTDQIQINTYYYKVMSDIGYTDPSFDHSSQDAQLAERENSSINTPFYQENKPIIDIIHRLKKHLSDILGFYETEAHMSLLEGDMKKNIRKSIHLMNQHIMIAEKIYNRKEKVPANLQHILLYLLVTEGSVNDAAKAFLQKREELLEFTSKQAGKLQAGSIPDLLPILRPYSRDVAIFLGYFGLPCIHCGSWEVKEKPGSGHPPDLECWSCDGEKFKARTIAKCSYCQIPLYEEELAAIIKTGKCKVCHTEITYPDELVQNQFDLLIARIDTSIAFTNQDCISKEQRKVLQEKINQLLPVLAA